MKARLSMVIVSPSASKMSGITFTARESTTITISALGGECRPHRAGGLGYYLSWHHGA